jgi:hypothetical protein
VGFVADSLVKIGSAEEQEYLVEVLEETVRAEVEVQQKSSDQPLVELKLEEPTLMVVLFAVVAGKQWVKV